MITDATTNLGEAEAAKVAKRKPDQSWRQDHLHLRWNGPGYVMSDEERAARRAAYAERDRVASKAHTRRREIERQAARAADAARLAEEVRKIRGEARLGLLPPPGRLAAVDMDALLLIGPLGAVGCGAALLRSLAVLMGKGRHPVPALVAAGSWKDEAALQTAVEAFRPRLAAIGLRLCRRKLGWRLTSA
ncbi:hypothetical protein Q8W71_07340 [Methylobacterium sp. NEAU 140]|uniref:hypothetical protein n=1 Tax=Methylobacterium sp. NEAU 140 TaxID=3064945 RepID=UPI002736ABA0|nr:hypothetical protein [Methylobacterium sp. NEAU 140]MDP4022431.1 hypothetical protein [Methylobacterium sp. NEAU 140]